MKVQSWSRTEIRRDRQCNEPYVVRGFPEDRQGHSRNHVEEGCEREYKKRKDGTSHDDVYDTPLHTNKHRTSWRFDLVSPWGLDHSSVSRQDTHGTLGPLRRKAVGGSTSRARARDTGHRHTSCEHGWRPHKPGRGVKVRGTEAHWLTDEPWIVTQGELTHILCVTSVTSFSPTSCAPLRKERSLEIWERVVDLGDRARCASDVVQLVAHIPKPCLYTCRRLSVEA